MKVSVTEDSGERWPSVWNRLGVISRGYTKCYVEIYPDEVLAPSFIGQQIYPKVVVMIHRNVQLSYSSTGANLDQNHSRELRVKGQAQKCLT